MPPAPLPSPRTARPSTSAVPRPESSLDAEAADRGVTIDVIEPTAGRVPCQPGAVTDTDQVAIDLLSPESFAHGQPHDQFAWLREHDPVHRHDEPDGPGFWAVTRYADVKAIGRDAATFSSSPKIMIPDEGGDLVAATSTR